MNTILKVTPDQVRYLIDSPEKSVDLVRDLLWSEARRQGINPLSISVPDNIYSPDGGVDGTVIKINPKKEGLLFQGTTYYQIKWGKTFDPRNENKVMKELLKNGSLKPKLEELAKKKGTYVLVWFGGTFESNDDELSINIVKNVFKESGFSEINVTILDIEKIAQLCSLHPYIQSTYFNRLTEYFLTLDQWMGRFVDENQEREEIEVITIDPRDVEVIQNAEINSPFIPIQLISYKNKDQYKYNRQMVFEGLKKNGLKQITICVDAENFGPPLNTTLESRSDLNQIIIIDNCEKKYHRMIIDFLGQRTLRLGVIIISDDGFPIEDRRFYLMGQRHLRDSNFLIEIASKNSEDNIIQKHPISISSVPEQKVLELPLQMESIFNQMTQKHGHDLLNLAKRVLRYMALFSKIGSEINITRELNYLSEKMGFTSPHGKLKFIEIIHILRGYNIIKGQYYIKVSNEEFRLFFIQEWWKIYGSSVDFESFLREVYIFSEDLAQRLLNSIPYITSTDMGKQVAQAFLGESGIFSSGKLIKDEFGSQLFEKLTEADPQAALDCLKRTLGLWNRDELLRFTTGRREIVWSLEKMAIWRDLFPDAAKILLSLGEAENETWSNNASGIFADLFSNGYGKLAPTEASPKERFPILKGAVESNIKKRRILGLNACDRALESHYFVRPIGPEYQGTRKEPKLWTPKTYGELFDAYRAIWDYLLGKLDTFEEDEQTQTIDILLKHARALGKINSLTEIVIATIEELMKKTYVDKKRVLKNIIHILHYDGKRMSEETRQTWEQLERRIIGDDFSSRMKRFVGMDLIEDKYDEEGNRIDKIKQQIEILINEAIKDVDKLKNELNWLVTKDAPNGYQFGYELGKKDKDYSLLPLLLEAQQDSDETVNISLLSGYFRVIYEDDIENWERQLDSLVRDQKLFVIVPELTSRSGVTDSSAIRILDLVKNGSVNIGSLRLFGPNGAIQDISKETFQEIIEFLLDNPDPIAVSIALDIHKFYYISKGSKHILPEEITLQLLKHKYFYQQPEASLFNDMEDFCWTEIGKVFVQTYQKRSIEIVDQMLDHFGEENTIFEAFQSHTPSVLNEIYHKDPKEVWNYIKKYLGPPFNLRALNIIGWLVGDRLLGSGDQAPISLLSPEDIWEWIDEDIENRAWYFAKFTPKPLTREEGKICWMREVLIRYGSREDVRINLNANFSTEGWSGSSVLHYQKKKQKLLDFRKEEDNEDVKHWIDEYLSILDLRIERAIIQEERRGF